LPKRLGGQFSDVRHGIMAYLIGYWSRPVTHF
jgi:hypothetical protein